jgi:hypothetical protein
MCCEGIGGRTNRAAVTINNQWVHRSPASHGPTPRIPILPTILGAFEERTNDMAGAPISTTLEPTVAALRNRVCFANISS